MTDWRFDRSAIRCFRFVRCTFDAASGEVALVYAFDDGPELIETLRIPGAPFQPEPAAQARIQHALRLLHLIAGVSYFKAAVPPEIAIDDYAIDAGTAGFLQSVYENGLGEFAYQNRLGLRGKVVFAAGLGTRDSGLGGADSLLEPVPVDASNRRLWAGDRELAQPASASPESRVPSPGATRVPSPVFLTAIGGGKDSLVTIEALRAVGIAQTVAWIGSAPLIRACAERTGLPTLNIERKLAPALFEYNRQGAYNGHIPVTAVNSAILLLAALLHGCDAVVFSNERSASYGSLIPGTGEVNHQWSKGWDFEQAFAAQVQRSIGHSPRYFSLLRPLSELAVARQFARIDRYDAHFSSCNRNFHILGERPASRWCGVCPKCRFVFLALAPFMPKPRLVAIFGRNLLDEAEQAAGFDALIEFRDHKPFECVGEGAESRAAFNALAELPAWREDALVARFAREVRPQLRDADLRLAPLLEPAAEHGVPAELWSKLDAHFRT